MKKMRKFRIVLAGSILAAVLGLAGCGEDKEQTPGPGSETVEESLPTEEPSAMPSEVPDADADGSEAPEQTDKTETDGTGEVVLEGPAAELLDKIVLGWSLGNTLDSYSAADYGKNVGLGTETSWGNPKVTKELMDVLKENGINAVRVPVTWYNHMDSSNHIDEEWMDRVQEVVDYVTDNGMYCILNVHHDTGTEGWLRASDTNLEENKARFASIWEQICERFGDYDEHLLFEGFNEILNDDSDWVNPDSRALEVTNELNQLFVDTVRASGGNNGTRILVVNTYCAGSGSSMTDGFVLPNDTVENSIIVSAHVYQPFNFTAEEFPNAVTWTKAPIDSSLKNLYTSFVQKGIPVVIGEFGCVAKDNQEQRLSWAEYYLEICREYGFKCFWWDNGSGYRLINRRTLEVAEKNLLGMLVAAAKGEEFTPQNEEEREETDNLCADVDNWTGWVNPSAKAEISYLADGISVEVTNAGEEEWYIQPTFVKLALEEGASYELSFDYSATVDLTLPFIFQQNYDPYTGYVTGSVDCTQEVQHYSAVITMTAESDDNVALVFNCGKQQDKTPYTITITNLKLVRQ